MATKLKIPPFAKLPEEPPGELLFASPWEITTGQDGGDADHWDYLVNLRFSRALEIDLAAFREACQLSEDARIAVFAEWSTDLTNYMRGRGEEVEIDLDEDRRIEVSLSLPIWGSQTGGTLYLHTFVMLVEENSPQPGGARVPGSVLWQTTEKRILESPGSRLPVCVVNFKDFPEKFDNPNAAWVVEVVPEGFELPPSVGMEIYLNSQHQELVELVSPDDSSYGSAFATQMMYFDIGRQLISRAVSDEVFCDPEHQYPEGSLGDSLRARARLLFPNLTLPQIGALHREAPQRFETIVQGALLEFPS
ncbi:hypothetical protein FIV42_15485 [Persicimonas caeni]|uniref:Uncharacterized protein n=1 Tax=Persicimonas caeni TaxID=2292766 RepID=A0A4Y6PUS2_PERCE|nr:hypothetical protein [Persicimonas caeni]QDG52094.1 hypothetical protein FIV42_15485 [Persicimonas caeni]QED33315.1 hypothetical protein FRD00_15480 [Persicimonas caeni]